MITFCLKLSALPNLLCYSMLVFKFSLLSFHALLLLIVEFSRDLTNQLWLGVIAVTPASADLSNEASKLINPASSKIEYKDSPAAEDIHEIHGHVLPKSPDNDAMNSPLVEESLEPDAGLSLQHHELKSGPTQSNLAPVGHGHLREEDMEGSPQNDRETKKVSEISTVARTAEEEANSQASRSSASGAKAATGNSKNSSNYSENASRFNGRKNLGVHSTSQGRPGPYHGQNNRASGAQPNPVGYNQPYVNEPVADSPTCPPSTEYTSPPQFYDSSQHQPWEWQLHLVNVLQPKWYYELESQLHYFPVQKQPTSFSPVSSYHPGKYSKLRHVGHPSPYRSSQYSGRNRKSSFSPGIPRVKEEIGKNTLRVSILNKPDLKSDHRVGKVLEKHPEDSSSNTDRSSRNPEEKSSCTDRTSRHPEAGESSGTGRSSSSSKLHPVEETLDSLKPKEENSPKYSFTLPQQDKQIDQSRVPKAKTPPERPNNASEEPKNAEPESIPAKISTPEAPNRLSDNLKQKDTPHDRVSTLLKAPEGPVTPEPLELPLTPEAPNEPIGPEASKERIAPEAPRKPIATEALKEPSTPVAEENKGSITADKPKGSITTEATKEPSFLEESPRNAGRVTQNDLSETKEDVVDTGELKKVENYNQDLEFHPSTPASDSHLGDPVAFRSNEQASEQKVEKLFSFHNDPSMKSSSFLEIKSKKPSPKRRMKQTFNLYEQSGGSRRKIIQENPTLAEELDKSLGPSSHSQPRNRFEILDKLDELHGDNDHTNELKASNQPRKNEDYRELEMPNQSQNKKIILNSNLKPERSSNLGSTPPATASEMSQDHTRLRDRIGESVNYIIHKAWDKKPNLRVGIVPSTAKFFLQKIWVNSPGIPSTRSIFDIMDRIKAKISQPEMQAKTQESSRIIGLEKNPSTGIQNHPGEMNKSDVEEKNFQDPLPSYVHDYIQDNPEATKREIELMRVLGNFLKVDSKEPLLTIHFSPSHPDYELMIEFIKRKKYLNRQKRAEDPVGKQFRWIFRKIGESEGRRRWKAIIRQHNQPEIHRKWEEVKKNNSLSPVTIKLFERTLRLSETWPTFYGSSSRELQSLDLDSMPSESRTRRVLVDVLGEDELESRGERFIFMSYRSYPHNWLPENEIKSAYQQGLNTLFIVLIGDLLQFGRRYFILHGVAGIPDYPSTFTHLMAAWDKSSRNIPWGSSPEKAWFLSQPERAKLYESRMTHFKDCLKHYFTGEKLEPEKDGDGANASPWWNLSDQLEWQEYHMDSNIMVRIGEKLNLSASRDKIPGEEKLNKILKRENVSKEMEEKIYRWFQSNSYSPHTRPTAYLEKETLVNYLLKQLEDSKSFFLSAWRQKSLWPHVRNENYQIQEISSVG